MRPSSPPQVEDQFSPRQGWVLVMFLLVVLFWLLTRSCDPSQPAAQDAPEAGAPLALATEVRPAGSDSPPVLTAPRDGAVVPLGLVTLEGQATPGGTVEVLVNGERAGITPVDENGRWLYTLLTTTPGPLQVTLRTIGPADEVLAQAPPVTLLAQQAVSGTISVTLNPTTRTPTPFASTPFARQTQISAGVITMTPTAASSPSPAPTLTVASTATTAAPTPAATNTARPTAEAAATSPAPGGQVAIAYPQAGASLPAGDLLITGIAPPGARVQILADDAPIGVVTANAAGQWSYIYSPQPGPHNLIARLLRQGEPGPAGPAINVEVAAPPPVRPNCSQGILTEHTYIVGTCENLAQISDITEIAVEELLAANPGIDPNLIFPGQVLTLPE